jgi:hypothetical protein
VKTIVEISTNLSKYLLDDAEVVVLNDDNIVVGDPAKFIIGDLNASTATIYESVTAPADWVGNKYTFDGTDWTLNPDWVDPATPVEETPTS